MNIKLKSRDEMFLEAMVLYCKRMKILLYISALTFIAITIIHLIK